MKKKQIGVFALSIGLLLTSCGDASTDAPEEGKEPTTEQPAEETMTISDEMADFIAPFDGNYESVEASLMKYGANEDIIDHDMGLFNLKNPKITAQKDNCYSLTCISGAVENYYEICWEDGKIISIVETY